MFACFRPKPTRDSERVRELELELEESAKKCSNLALKVEELQGALDRHKDVPKPTRELPVISGVLNSIQRAVEQFFLRRDEDRIRTVFDKYKHHSQGIVVMESLGPALHDLGLVLTEEEVKNLFFTVDIDNSGGLGLEAFKRAVAAPTGVEQWARTLPLSELLATCLPVHANADPVRQVAQLGDTELKAACNAFSDGLRRMLKDAQEKLARSYQELDNRAKDRNDGAANKFATFKMSCGGTLDFHKGLSERIGAPHLDVKKGMEAEHCFKACCTDHFTTAHYNVTTNPRYEYEVATGKRSTHDAVPAGITSKSRRVVRPIAQLMQLQVVRDAKLSEEEVLAVVLYTGPMYHVYNTILRRFPVEDFRKFEAGGNLFSTTIHVLVSAVAKISRVMKLPEGLKLFRGLGGLMELPESFWKADEHGCRGYTEWGFLSTTSSKETALQFSGVSEGHPNAMVLELPVGSIDRGAYIAELSQYPQEHEYLWVPCSFLEPVGAPVVEAVPEGVVTVVRVSAHANLKAQTLEQLREQKRSAHLAAFRYAIDETWRDLQELAHVGRAQDRLARDPFRQHGGVTHTVEDFLVGIFVRCEAVFQRHADMGPEQYLDDGVYRGLVVEMLDTKEAACDSLRLYLENDSMQIPTVQELPLGEAHREYLAFLRRRLPAEGEPRVKGAVQLCVAMGLLRSPKVDGVDSEGLTPFMSAAADGAAFAALELLVAARSSLDARDAQCRTAVYLAAAYGHADTIAALRRLGADIDAARDDGTTPVYIAVQDGHAAAVEVLCTLGANLNRAQRDGRTPLFVAAQCGHADLVRLLAGRGASVNTQRDDGRTPLHAAAHLGSAAVVQALVSVRADLKAVSRAGTTVLETALKRDNKEAAQALLLLGAR